MLSDLLMPADEIAEFAARAVIGTVLEVAPQLIFNKYVARYFHGIGRQLIRVCTLGQVPIPSSLRTVPKGTKPKPDVQDWVALFAGVMFWGVCAAAVIHTLFFW
jgi:hypothetical protein